MFVFTPSVVFTAVLIEDVADLCCVVHHVYVCVIIEFLQLLKVLQKQIKKKLLA